MRGLLVGILVALALAATAGAASPVLTSVDHQSRHPHAMFSLPGADDATIYLATKPDRASDGSFLRENVKDLDLLTDDEIQSGSWLYESQIDPGTYYVMMRATDFDCLGQPDCLNGFSNMLTLRVPKPAQRYRVGIQVFHYSQVAYLTLRVIPLGEKLPYKVCWRLQNKHRKCAAGTVAGYSWNSDADDSLRVSLRGMAKRTSFTWYARGVRLVRVAAKTADTTRR